MTWIPFIKKPYDFRPVRRSTTTFRCRRYHYRPSGFGCRPGVPKFWGGAYWDFGGLPAIPQKIVKGGFPGTRMVRTPAKAPNVARAAPLKKAYSHGANYALHPSSQKAQNHETRMVRTLVACGTRMVRTPKGFQGKQRRLAWCELVM